MQTKLYVGNLSYNVTEADLRTLFSQAGEIKEVALIMDRDTRQPKGFGFVEMTTQAEAEKAIQMFNEHFPRVQPAKSSLNSFAVRRPISTAKFVPRSHG